MIPSERRQKERDQSAHVRGTQSGRPGAGGLLLLIGIIGIVLALNLDTSVSTSAGRVNNLGLMNDKQNYLILAGVIALIGAVLQVRDGTGATQDRSSSPDIQHAAAEKKCPDCAEMVHIEAKVCRFCGNRDFEGIGSDAEVSGGTRTTASGD